MRCLEYSNPKRGPGLTRREERLRCRDGIKLYHEIYGSSEPLVLIHGGLTTIGEMQGWLQPLAKTRQVIAVEMQGHGRTVEPWRPPLRLLFGGRPMNAILLTLALLAAPPEQPSPLPTAAPSVERNIPYIPGGGHKQQLDLHLPRGKGFPTVLFVHGGSLQTGDRTEPPYEKLCEAFRTAGIACAKASYRLASEAKWPAMPKDVAAAFAWLHHHIREQGGDPGRIFLFGHSSGCHLAAVVGSDERYLKEHGLAAEDVAGVVAMGCILNQWDVQGRGISRDQARQYFEADPDEVSTFESLDERIAANPSLYIGPRVPPTLVLVAEAERFQPPILEQAAVYVRKLREVNVDADVRVLEGRNHMSAVERMSEPGDPVFRLVLDFVRRFSADRAPSAE